MRRALSKKLKLGWFIIGAWMIFKLTALVIAAGCMTSMPGKSHEGTIPAATDDEKTIAANLEKHVRELADKIGERNISNRYVELKEAAEYIEKLFASLGLETKSQTYEVEGVEVRNIEAIIRGNELNDEVVVVGAHYDSALGTPGANDNASGVAALLELARTMRDDRPKRELRFVAFVNEEPPYFQTHDMGSYRYAARCSDREEKVEAMIALDTIGYYSDLPGSQMYPPLVSAFYPKTGNFIAFVGNSGSSRLVKKSTKTFRQNTKFPSEGAVLPKTLPGVGWSDHWSFWEHGYDGLMVTDTALYRYPFYHHPKDTPDKLDYERAAKVTRGLVHVVRALHTPTKSK